jgi:hypothetical protein
MATLATDPQRRSEMVAAARERYQKLFAPTVAVPEILKLYQRVTGNGHSVNDMIRNNNHLHPWLNADRQ